MTRHSQLENFIFIGISILLLSFNNFQQFLEEDIYTNRLIGKQRCGTNISFV